jgi:hypothetical protein
MADRVTDEREIEAVAGVIDAWLRPKGFFKAGNADAALRLLAAEVLDRVRDARSDGLGFGCVETDAEEYERMCIDLERAEARIAELEAARSPERLMCSEHEDRKAIAYTARCAECSREFMAARSPSRDGTVAVEDVVERAEAAVFACLPLLPLNGSDGQGYRLSERIDPRLVALPEEWATAAQAIADLHAALAEFSRPSTDDQPSEKEKG